MMKATKLHINATIGMMLYAIQISGMLALAGGMVWVLTFTGVDTNGHSDIMFVIIGALLPTIGSNLREFASIVKRFTYMTDADEEE